MAGVKRSHVEQVSDPENASHSPFVAMFEGFRAELDEHHDRRERVIKAFRDITAQSKKITRELGQPIHNSITKQIEPMQSTINGLFQTVLADLEGLNANRYQRNISGGIQEYMEAVLFQYYLENQEILRHSDASRMLPGDTMLTHEDYLLGLFDMTGELMRFAITYMATNGKLPGSGHAGSSHSILADMQELRSQLENMDAAGSHALSRDFEQKMKTTRSSVEKVENSVYSMTVRGKERPKGWRPDISHMDDRKDVEAGESY